MIAIFIITTALYVTLILAFIIGYDKIELFESQSEYPSTTFSIVIPFRNEAKNLNALLDSILDLNYPLHLFEVILVDDESEDDSLKIIKKVLETKYSQDNLTQIEITIIKNSRLTNSPKKDAITEAIKHSKYNWIATTDADCLLPRKWLQNFDAFIQKYNPKMIVAPVDYSCTNSFLEGFQILDFWSLQTVTIGAFGISKPFMNNGANLAYKKEAFFELNGFEGNDNIASGDDLFIMEKLLRSEPESVQYIKSKTSIVITKPQASWKELFNQRIRWAAKSSAYKSIFPKITGLIVLLMNTSLICMLTLFIINEFSGSFLLLIFSIKLLIDYLAINKSALFFDKDIKLKYFTFSSFIYPFFSVSVVLYSMFFKYKWKGRAFKQ